MPDSYWDPLPHIEPVFAELPAFGLRPDPEDVFRGRWEDLNWRNVPGPLYGGMTDTCFVGRQGAPRHIMYCEDGEFLYRQPTTAPELRDVLIGMRYDPWSGWACDGDEHWTPDLVRAWWRDRRRVRDWILCMQLEWGAEGEPFEEHEAAGLVDYLAYLDGGLATDLRVYLHFLDHGRGPAPGEPLPPL
ncbi:hypothetical protein [Dactylosporangium sp. CS-033363]|uniref:hypothetical protein n=1 Tax=Dactylosporangium sp. CS-033363 TaxID=3239935 RepID=UPI003D8B0A55